MNKLSREKGNTIIKPYFCHNFHVLFSQVYYYFSFPIVTFGIWLALVFYGLEQTCITIIRLLLDVMSVLQTKSHSTSLERGLELVKVTLTTSTPLSQLITVRHSCSISALECLFSPHLLSLMKGSLVLASLMSSAGHRVQYWLVTLIDTTLLCTEPSPIDLREFKHQRSPSGLI